MSIAINGNIPPLPVKVQVAMFVSTAALCISLIALPLIPKMTELLAIGTVGYALLPTVVFISWIAFVVSFRYLMNAQDQRLLALKPPTIDETPRPRELTREPIIPKIEAPRTPTEEDVVAPPSPRTDDIVTKPDLKQEDPPAHSTPPKIEVPVVLDPPIQETPPPTLGEATTPPRMDALNEFKEVLDDLDLPIQGVLISFLNSYYKSKGFAKAPQDELDTINRTFTAIIALRNRVLQDERQTLILSVLALLQPYLLLQSPKGRKPQVFFADLLEQMGSEHESIHPFLTSLIRGVEGVTINQGSYAELRAKYDQYSVASKAVEDVKNSRIPIFKEKRLQHANVYKMRALVVYQSAYNQFLGETLNIPLHEMREDARELTQYFLNATFQSVLSTAFLGPIFSVIKIQVETGIQNLPGAPIRWAARKWVSREYIMGEATILLKAIPLSQQDHEEMLDHVRTLVNVFFDSFISAGLGESDDPFHDQCLKLLQNRAILDPLLTVTRTGETLSATSDAVKDKVGQVTILFDRMFV